MRWRNGVQAFESANGDVLNLFGVGVAGWRVVFVVVLLHGSRLEGGVPLRLLVSIGGLVRRISSSRQTHSVGGFEIVVKAVHASLTVGQEEYWIILTARCVVSGDKRMRW